MATAIEIELKLDIDEINTVLESLGNLPYLRVHKTIEKIMQQATAQVAENNLAKTDVNK